MRHLNRFPDPTAADLLMREAGQLAAHPDANATIGAVLHLTGAVPELAGLREHITAHIADLPCLTHVLTGDGPTARWDPAVPDIARHVRAQRLADEPEALQAAVRLLLREPWPERVPAWRMILLHGHGPDRFALLYLTHHAVQDGGSIVTVLETLFGPRLPPGQFSVVTRDVSPTRRPGLCQTLRTTVTLLRRARSHHLWHWPARPLSSRRHTLWAQASSADLRTAARAGGASTNDVQLTALAHAITQWAEDAWPRATDRPLPLMVPVNLRTPDEAAAPGNRLFLTRIDLPAGAMPLARRLAHTRAATPVLKSAGHKTVLRAALTRLPRPLLQRLVAMCTTPGRLTVCASSVVMRHSLHYGTAAVHRIDPVICCPPGVPMAVVATTYKDTTSACFRIDHALPDAAGLPARWRQALADLATTDSDQEPAGRTTPAVRALLTRLVQRSAAADARRR